MQTSDTAPDPKRKRIEDLIKMQELEKKEFLLQQDSQRNDLHQDYERKSHDLQDRIEQVGSTRDWVKDTQASESEDLALEHKKEINGFDEKIRESKLRQESEADPFEKARLQENIIYLQDTEGEVKKRHVVETENLNKEHQAFREKTFELLDMQEQRLKNEKEIVSKEHDQISTKLESKLGVDRELFEMKQKKEMHDAEVNQENIDKNSDRPDTNDSTDKKNDHERTDDRKDDRNNEGRF
ncbi:MAG: hypothetical protein KGI02_03860 [Thaumarchaeota archaeon]|nr:hypothetical protein [Nitrososphaerota archaeon]MDE1877822.1 hypothetical protein [Nitrososphaerota archaeon]